MKKFMMAAVGFFLTVPSAYAGAPVTQQNISAAVIGKTPSLIAAPGALGPLKVGVRISTVGASSRQILSYVTGTYHGGDDYEYSTSAQLDAANDISGAIRISVVNVPGAVSIDVTSPVFAMGPYGAAGRAASAVRKGSGYCYDVSAYSGCSIDLFMDSYLEDSSYGGGRYRKVDLRAGDYTVTVRFRDGSRKQTIIHVPAPSGYGIGY